jgi:glycosyltransferase involved in cell wall biosynthesis
MLMTALIPTYKRPDHLHRCLSGFAAQHRMANEILVTVRPDDEFSANVLRTWRDRIPVRQVTVERPGVVEAMNAGVSISSGDIVALTDDDAVPRPDWLQRIERFFATDPRVGAVGGRDVLRSGEVVPPQTDRVGLVEPFGRVVGNHHIGKGPVRAVDHLKGVNLSWRKCAAGAVPFPRDLRGEGAQVFFELSFCFRLQREGWKILYDPDLVVDHYVGERQDDDGREQKSVLARQNAAFNFYLALQRELSPVPRRVTALWWAELIGTREMPGLLRESMAALKGDSNRRQFAASIRSVRRDVEAYHRRQKIDD